MDDGSTTMSESTSATGKDEGGAGLDKNTEIPEESVASDSELALDRQAERINGKDE